MFKTSMFKKSDQLYEELIEKYGWKLPNKFTKLSLWN